MTADSRKKPIIKKKDGLIITIEYEDKTTRFELEDPEAEFEDPVYHEYPVREITVKSSDGEEIKLSRFWPETTRLIGPIKDIVGPGLKYECYDNYEDIIFFEGLAKNGGLLNLLHEIGHARRNRPDMSEPESERQAWGFALRNLKKIREESGLDLEPGMTPAEIRKHIKRSLLTHEIGDRYMETYVRKLQSSKDKPSRPAESYWRTARPEDIEKLIDEMYDKTDFEFNEREVPRENLKKSFR